MAITKDQFVGALESLLVGLGEELLAWVFPSGVATRRRALEVEMNLASVLAALSLVRLRFHPRVASARRAVAAMPEELRRAFSS